MGVQYHAFERKHRAVVAVDLGKMMDYSAIAVIEREQIGNDQWEFKEGNQSYEGSETFYRMRALRRLPLGMDYVSQVKEVAEILRRVPAPKVDLVLDATGVGAPVCDLFGDAGLKPVRITITAGDGKTQNAARDWRVSKISLVSKLEAMLHTGDLKISREVAEGEALREELRDFQRLVTQAGHTRFEGRVGKHDDLVLATALGVWWIARPEPVAREVKIVGW